MLNLAMLLEDSAREVPERTAIVCEETRLSYAELNAATSQVAPFMIADLLADNEQLAHSLPVYGSPEVKQVEVTCHLMHGDFCSTSFYTFV